MYISYISKKKYYYDYYKKIYTFRFSLFNIHITYILYNVHINSHKVCDIKIEREKKKGSFYQESTGG